ncbi:hypothetical protein B0H17DRAFT_1102170 [Mycena rosella]|uniref:F-box domain-containing protein n=1 Tax=Mycena rosella TaxID=1033263 RepID=A0AAD7G0G9_MYCRO|nr:hypothetical protein B0H17DRAFT_1102170 [Mycena rosella]
MAIYGGKPSVSDSLPTEILHEIAAALGTAKDRSALSRTSWLFNAVTTPILFRYIYLGSVETALGCLNTLIKNPARRDCVRSLSIVIQTSGGDYVPTDMIYPLEAVLRTLSHLEDLYIRIPDFDDRYLVIFATLLLPELRRFSTYHPGSYAPLFSSFLRRHPHLTHLDLIRPWVAQDPDPPRVPRLPFHNLSHYRGCSVYATALVVPHRTLASVELWDAPRTTDVATLLAALGAASAPAAPFALTFLWDGAPTTLFKPLAKSIPHIRTLIVGPFMAPPRPLSTASVQEIAEALESLVGLASLDFNSVQGDTQAHPVHADLAVLTAWSARCPSLVTSRLHCRNWTRIGGKWVLVN